MFVLLLFVNCKDDTVVSSIQIQGSSTKVLEAEGTSFTLNFTSPSDWVATSSQAWCTISPSSGVAGQASLNVQVEENLTSSPREATITFTAGSLTESVLLSQSTHDGASFIRITHSSTQFPTPLLSGSSPIATIHWGDGNQDKYDASLVHDYTQDETHHLTLVVYDATQVEIPTLDRVTEIDLSEF